MQIAVDGPSLVVVNPPVLQKPSHGALGISDEKMNSTQKHLASLMIDTDWDDEREPEVVQNGKISLFCPINFISILT